MKLPSAASSSTNLRVFLVENHRDTREYIQMYLEMLGHTVQSADSMTEALAALPLADYDLLISDIGLPDGDGWELLHRLQLPRPIYAVAMSGFCMGADQLKSKEAGFRHHLLKPINPEEFDRMLAEAVQAKAATATAAFAKPT